MKAILYAVLAVSFLITTRVAAHPSPKDSLERVPLGTELILHRDINLKPRTGSTLIVDDGNTGCSIRHDESDDDRLLKAGTRLVVGSLRHLQYGFHGQLYAAILDIGDYKHLSLSCSTFRSDHLTFERVLSSSGGLLEFRFPPPRELSELGSAADQLRDTAMADIDRSSQR